MRGGRVGGQGIEERGIVVVRVGIDVGAFLYVGEGVGGWRDLMGFLGI